MSFCPIERRKVVRHVDVIGATALLRYPEVQGFVNRVVDVADEGIPGRDVVEVTRCGVPLFTKYRVRGACRQCLEGWQVPDNRLTESGQAALKALDVEVELLVDEPKAAMLKLVGLAR